jgi:hypothetical protein
MGKNNWKYLGELLKNDANHFLNVSDSSPSFFGIDDHSRMRNMGRSDIVSGFGSNIKVSMNMPFVAVDEIYGIEATIYLNDFYQEFCK